MIRPLLLLLLLLGFNKAQGQVITAPTEIPDNLLWLDAGDPNADGIAPADATAINTWRDKSGLNNDAVVHVGNGPAAFRSQAGLTINGRPVMAFTSNNTLSGDVYRVPGVDIRPTANPDISIFVVYRQKNVNNIQNALWGADNQNWDRFFYINFSIFGDGVNDGVVGLGPGQQGAVIPNSGVANTTHLLSVVYDGNVQNGINNGPNNASLVRFGNTIITNFTDTSDAVDQQNALFIGWDGDDGAGDFYLAEFIVYNRLLTVCETSQVIDYLSLRYGESFSQTITTQPTEAEICSPDDVQFTVTTNGAGLNFQWQVDTGTGTFTDLTDTGIYTGSNTNQLTLTSPAVATTGQKYRVVVTRPSGCFSISDEAELVVHPITTAPTANAIQSFCDVDNATIAQLQAIGDAIIWYDAPTGGNALANNTPLTNGTYYASQTQNGCESTNRSAVQLTIYPTLPPPTQNLDLVQCDNTLLDGDDNNGSALFDLTANNALLLNGNNAADFNIQFFTDAARTNAIANPTNFVNSTNGQTIYARLYNALSNSCFTDVSFNLNVLPVPQITTVHSLQNCDEDGVLDGFTDFNLNEAIPFITTNPNHTISFYSSNADATTGNNPITATPYNNTNGNTVYARVANPEGCFKTATINLQVSTTTFPANFGVVQIESCDNDNLPDGIFTFNLEAVANDFLAPFPLNQNLSVYYYHNLADAQLEQNEIENRSDYRNEDSPLTETLYVRVESEDNGSCFGIGPFLELRVLPRPVFEIEQQEVYCSLDPITLAVTNPTGDFDYQWTDPTGAVVSTQSSVTVLQGGTYTVVATSADGCQSFPATFDVVQSSPATITLADITTTELSNNNSIRINTANLGIGEYEFALDDALGPYQDEAFFNNVLPGTHTLYIRDKNGCGTTEIRVDILGFPTFFTPNNDNNHDYWQILGMDDTYTGASTIYIFDRYGKLLKQIAAQSQGWDGFYNNKALPSSDYWFKAQLVRTDGSLREINGHFSLIR